MRVRLSLLGALCIAVALMTPVAFAAEAKIVYVTRHGEKAGPEKDADLSAAGQTRARNLAYTLARAGVNNIFSTATARARHTAQPLATARALEIQTYDPAQQAALAAKLKGLNGASLVVGHSNTITELVRLLGGAPGDEMASMADAEFDRLYQVVIGPDGTVTTTRLQSIGEK